MKIHQFLDHYGITENPFSQEDAASDRVFQEHCLSNGTHHSAWDKIYGDPKAPATSVVFGEQGAGKTALRLQMVTKLKEFNRKNPEARSFIVQYDDFNPFLDTFRERLSSRQRKPERALQNWRLWDHMDAILTLATTRLCNAIRNDGKDLKDETHNIAANRLSALTRPQRRDVMLMAAFYDQDRELSSLDRWNLLRRKLRFASWRAGWELWLGILVLVMVLSVVWWQWSNWSWSGLTSYWTWGTIAVGWLPYLWRMVKLHWTAWGVTRQIRITDLHPGTVRKILGRFDRAEISGQPVPSRARGDDRYELLMKLQSVLQVLGFESIFVLVDRVDEPHLVNGSPERIRDLIWPMFDNKFLKHEGIAFKLLLPSAVVGFLNRQEKEFYERSRLDKQNLIQSLNWTGQGLFDVANDRIRACAKLSNGKPPGILSFFAPQIGEKELINVFDRLHAPRHLFKFLYRLLVDHCSKYTEDQPEWKIQPDTLQSSLAVFMRDLDAYYQKQGTG